MKFICPLLVVENIEKSRVFYETVMLQKVKFDFGENIVFEGDFAIHQKEHFSKLIDIEKINISTKSNNSELYFEEDALDDFISRLNKADVIYVHNLKEQPWGQRVIRFYDPDMHIIEVGETMEAVAQRFLSKGLNVKDTAERISMPVDFVEQVKCKI
ncbi:catechol 2,3-dioxygenase-like lactoylglutathione lyase family enzyme [Desulfohalotomaculum tongense]|uniref:VOC family protein n=1 Tax=Desulforadius tongensis TaxID=1216062 RepID=UPI001957E110|nr:VOC family protein [Desulforadius tongensis]MBM7856129.1 catechol 2,3-dioxygenase-like lactoylglutathione lyase family enzyme [Desulforadius tongensis]